MHYYMEIELHGYRITHDHELNKIYTTVKLFHKSLIAMDKCTTYWWMWNNYIRQGIKLETIIIIIILQITTINLVMLYQAVQSKYLKLSLFYWSFQWFDYFVFFRSATIKGDQVALLAITSFVPSSLLTIFIGVKFHTDSGSNCPLSWWYGSGTRLTLLLRRFSWSIFPFPLICVVAICNVDCLCQF